MKINCLIVDDEPFAVNLLEEYIHQIPYLELQHKCYHALEALEYLKHHSTDLILLDINMPHLSGMQLTTLLPAGQPFIFTTAHAEFAVESYENNAVDYLLKPIAFDRFLKAAEKVARQLQQPSAPALQKLFLKTGKAIVQVDYEDIYMIEGLKDYVIFHTRTGKHIVYKRMKELEEILPPHFSRIHLSYIINRNHVQRIEDNHVFAGPHQVPVGKKYKDDFWEKISKRLL